MRKPRNEILEAGQEVILYRYTDWSGSMIGTGTLAVKLKTGNDGRELWGVTTTSAYISSENMWWFGKVEHFNESNT